MAISIEAALPEISDADITGEGLVRSFSSDCLEVDSFDFQAGLDYFWLLSGSSRSSFEARPKRVAL